MPIDPTTLKALIDTQITNETVDFAITPNEVGSRMKDAIDYTTEQKALSEVLTNKSTNVSLGTSDTLYPTQKAVKTYTDSAIGDAVFDINQELADKENISNKSTNVTTDAASNTKYPSVKAVKDYVDANAGGASVVKSVKVTLTPLQVQSLFTTRVKVVDCLSGKAVLPIQMLCITDNPTTGYSPNGGGVVLRYDTLTTNILSCNTNLGTVGIGEGYATSATSLTSAGFSRNGEDIYIKAASNDPVGGDGGMVVYITYSEITL